MFRPKRRVGSGRGFVGDSEPAAEIERERVLGPVMRSRKTILLSAVLAVIALSAATSSAASASVPQWGFGGTPLSESESETVVGAALASSLKIESTATTCQHFLYSLEVYNLFSEGYASLNELPLFECTTTAPGCTVSSMEAENLPWFSYIEDYGGKPYIVIYDIEVKIDYSGASCALKGEKLLTGDAGGAIDNSNSTATFDKETFTATGTGMEVAGKSVEWTGEFTMEAFKSHRLQPVEAL